MASETYRIEFRPAAFRDLEALDKNTRVRVAKKIDKLASNPRPAGVKKLTGEENLWRVRVGAYRIIYSVDDGRLVVLIIRIRHRSEAYR